MLYESLVYPPPEEKYINDYDAYLLYNAVRLHYTTKSYSLLRYGFTANKSFNGEKYQTIHTWEVNAYNQWAKTFKTENNTKMALGAFFFYNTPKSLHDGYPSSDKVMEAYRKLKSFSMSMKHFLTEDLTTLQNNYTIDVFKVNQNIPELYNLAIKGVISYESLILIDFTTNLGKYTSTKIDTLSWNAFKYKYQKYIPFVITHLDNEFKTYIKQEILKISNT
jgi:hypothetical protein